MTARAPSYTITIDARRCTNCGLCVAFCPVEVFADRVTDASDTATPIVARPALCWGCETCVGQCPQQAVHVIAEVGEFTNESASDGSTSDTLTADDLKKAPPLPIEQRKLYRAWATTLKSTLNLRWEPVAITLVPTGEPLPDIPLPRERLRYCQSLMAARRGRSFLMPTNRHACPDGTSILGLTEMPAKLASGELYLLFHKLDSLEAARHMAHERPHLEPRSIQATAVTPLADARITPQVIAVFAQPEQAMWLLMSASYYTGHRFELQASGYNAQCVETTLIPYLTGQPNVSFGCYGCRASSDISDDLMFVGLPIDMMPTIVRGLTELGSKAIPQSRAKIYLPPLSG